MEQVFNDLHVAVGPSAVSNDVHYVIGAFEVKICVASDRLAARNQTR